MANPGKQIRELESTLESLEMGLVDYTLSVGQMDRIFPYCDHCHTVIEQLHKLLKKE